MIHIDKLILENFQTHKKTEIDFSKHFNVIVGASRTGKSSVVRALDFLFYNNWYEDYIRFGSDQVKITAKLSNGKTIIREKSTKVSKILIIDGDKEQRFESFGFTLPQEVIDVIGVSPIEIEAKEPILANVSNQDDPLFLLYGTGTDRTKILSRLSGLHWIDFALKDLNKDRRTKATEVELLKEANASLKEKLKGFSNLDKIKDDFLLEKERLTHLKHVESLVNIGKGLVAKITNWKKEYQLVQDLKKIDFTQETTRLDKLIYLASNIIQPLQELDRKLSVNSYSSGNVRINLQNLSNTIVTLENQIVEEEKLNPRCQTCGQEIHQEVH